MHYSAYRYFAAIAQHGSFRAAAENLHVAQSALSRQVQRLEDELGAPLLERRARGVSLTGAGEIMLRHVREAMEQMEHLRSELDALRGVRRGSVRIASIESVVPDLLAPVLARFADHYPGVMLNVTVNTTDEVVEAIQDVRADIGLAFHPRISSDIKVLFRLHMPLMALVGAKHRLAGQPEVSLADLSRFPLALPMPNSGSRILLDQAAKIAGTYLAPALETNSTELLIRFVLQTRAVTLLPEQSARDFLRRKAIVAIRLKEGLMNVSTMDVIALGSRKLPVAAEELVRMLEAGPEGSAGGPAFGGRGNARRGRKSAPGGGPQASLWNPFS